MKYLYRYILSFWVIFLSFFVFLPCMALAASYTGGVSGSMGGSNFQTYTEGAGSPANTFTRPASQIQGNVQNPQEERQRQEAQAPQKYQNQRNYNSNNSIGGESASSSPNKPNRQNERSAQQRAFGFATRPSNPRSDIRSGIHLKSSPKMDWAISQDSNLQDVLRKWCHRAGWSLVWDSQYSYVTKAGAVFHNTFIGATKSLFYAMHAVSPKLYTVIYTSNKVIVISNDPNV